MTVPTAELQKIAPSAIIELFELELNIPQHGDDNVYRFHAGTNLKDNGDIIWNGSTYQRFPVQADGFEYSGNGQLPRPKIRIANVFSTISALLLTLPDGLEGAKVTRIRTLARYLDAVNFPGNVNPLGTPDPTAEFPREIYYVDRKTTENRELVEFELAAAFDLAGVRAPKRQCISNMCQWEYRGPECGYTGTAYFNENDQAVGSSSLDVCGKRLSSCELRFAQVRRVGSVTSGSNILTLDVATNFNPGDPVTGFGLPVNTAVLSVSGNQVTVNKNATATTRVNGVAGTVQSNFSQLVVSSATGIFPGMIVTGNYLQPNTQITAVAGTTLTLSTAVDFTQFLTVAGTSQDVNIPFRFRSKFSTNFIYFPSAVVFEIGQYVSSSVLPLSERAIITGKKAVNNFGPPGATTSYNVAAISVAYTYTRGHTRPTWTFYNAGSAPSATYSFAVTDETYTFRSDAVIPYGSFPGVGTFFT